MNKQWKNLLLLYVAGLLTMMALASAVRFVMGWL